MHSPLPRRLRYALVPAIVLATSLGCSSSSSGTTEADAADSANGSDAADTGDSTDDADALLEGAACGPNVSPGCGAGLACVQSAPSYCSVDYLGTCTRLPTSCPPSAGDPVCGCNLHPYASECEARRAGETQYLGPCPVDAGADG